MDIEILEEKHIEECAALLMDTYNCKPWQNKWTKDTSEQYLKEFFYNPRFVGFVALNEKNLIGAAFCHERTWWTADELFVDEFYIAPEYQRRGAGTKLLRHIEAFAGKKKLAGCTLLTNKHMPAPDFYLKNGYIQAEHVIFMFKEI